MTKQRGGSYARVGQPGHQDPGASEDAPRKAAIKRHASQQASMNMATLMRLVASGDQTRPLMCTAANGG